VEYQNKMSTFTRREAAKNELSKISEKPLSIYVLDEDFLTIHMAISLQKSSSFNRVLNRKIDQLLQSGIIQKLEAERFSATKKKEREGDSKRHPQVLTFDHLGVCFAIIMILLAVSCVVFLIECLVGYFYRRFG
jgi:hypothetical protein